MSDTPRVDALLARHGQHNEMIEYRDMTTLARILERELRAPPALKDMAGNVFVPSVATDGTTERDGP